MHLVESWCEKRSRAQCDSFSSCLQFDELFVDSHKVLSLRDLIQTIWGPDTDDCLFLSSIENVTSALLIAEKLSHTIGTIALTGHVQYSWWADVLKASFVWVQRGSSLLSISFSQVTVSKKEKCCSGTKHLHGRPARFPSHDRCSTALQLTHDSCVWTLYFPSLCLDWHLTVFSEHDSGIKAVLSRLVNNFVPVDALLEQNFKYISIT